MAYGDRGNVTRWHLNGRAVAEHGGCMTTYPIGASYRTPGRPPDPTVFTWPSGGDITSSRVDSDIIAERGRQDAQWGTQNHSDEWWHLILTEEVGEVAQAVLHDRFGGHAAGTVRDELIQVAAVAVAWVEAIDRRQSQRTECSACGGPYDEETDSWGACADCLNGGL